MSDASGSTGKCGARKALSRKDPTNRYRGKRRESLDHSEDELLVSKGMDERIRGQGQRAGSPSGRGFSETRREKES